MRLCRRDLATADPCLSDGHRAQRVPAVFGGRMGKTSLAEVLRNDCVIGKPANTLWIALDRFVQSSDAFHCSALSRRRDASRRER